jgi:hypothetical protein
MEKQMRADRDKRAAILSAEGEKQAAILSAEGGKQAAVLRARGEAEAAVVRARADAESRALRAKGEADAIATVFRAIHEGHPDNELLAYQYLQMLPQIAQGDANKIWIVPSELGKALERLGGFFAPGTSAGERPGQRDEPAGKGEPFWAPGPLTETPGWLTDTGTDGMPDPPANGEAGRHTDSPAANGSDSTTATGSDTTG